MIYNKRSEAKIAFRKYKELKEVEGVEWFSYSENVKGFKIGDFLLFQHIHSGTISRPILAVFVGFSMWDMALVMSFVEVPRAFFYSDKYQVSYGKDAEYSEYIGHMDPEVETIQFWTDSINLLGHFKGKPTINELKTSLKSKIY